MKIAFYISSLNTKGGAERAITGLANWFSADNEVVMIVEKGSRNTAAYPLNEGVNFISIADCMSSFPVKQVALINAIKRQITAVNPDVVVSFLAYSNVRLMLSGVAKKYPVVLCERNDPESDPKEKYYRKLRDYLYKYADRIVVQTPDVKKYFEDKKCKNIDVIPNYVNTIDYVKVDREKTIVSVGRLSQQKNQKCLINAFVRSGISHKGYKLKIYGDGPLKEELADHIKKCGAQHFVLLCPPVNNILEVIRSAACFVLPSFYEGMPNALMEAMSIGLPCISTDCPCGGPRSLIENGENGVLLGVDNEEELTQAIIKITEDAVFAEKIADNALKIRTTHSIENNSLLWYKTFELANRN